MTQPDPFVALLSAIQDAQAAGGGTPNAFVPGAQGIPGAPGQPGTAESGGTPVAAVGGGASVPGTATTGAGVLEDIISGVGVSSDPLASQIPSAAFAGRREPGERGDLGADVTGGDVNTLLSILGGPTALASILGSLVASNELGLPPTTSLLSATSLADLVSGESSPGFGGSGEFGGAFNSDGSFTPAISTTGGGGTVNTIRQGIGGSRGDSTPGASSRERSLERERTTGRAVGPV